MNGFGMGEVVAGAWGSWMFAMTWQVALFMAIIWCIARLTGKAPAAFRYGLWMLVFVKLILPPTLSVDWSIMTVVSGYVTPVLPAISHEISYTFDTPEPEQRFSVFPATEGDDKEVVTPSPALISPATTNPTPIRVPFQNRGVILMGIWAFGALGLFLMSVLKYRRYVRRALLNSTPASPELMEQLKGLVRVYGLRRKFSLVVSRQVNTPVAFGVRHPKILLPQRALDELTLRQIQFLLGHELAHVKRYDEIAGWGVILLLCLYWFNPVIWLATVYLRREREMACDDMVVSNAVNDNKEYASTMVRVAEFYDGTAPAVAGFLGMLGVTDNLMFRVRAVLDNTRRRRAGLRAGIVLALLLLFFAPMGMLTISSEAQQPPSSPVLQTAPAPVTALTPEALLAAVDREIQQYYSKADQDVQEFMRGTAKNFGRNGLWLPEDTFGKLSANEREQKVAYIEGVLKGEYGRHLCEALAQAGALKDKRLLPGVMKAAAYHLEKGDYDCRAKWMAVAALGRLGDESAVPLLVSLIDHGNKNTQIWARASLVRITGQNLGTEKKAWGDWWNGAKKQPAITEEQLKPWKVQAASSESQQSGSSSAMTPEALQAEVDREIQQYYSKVDPDVQEYIRWTAKTFGRNGLWLPQNAFEKLSADEREKKVAMVEEVLKGEYGRNLCEVLGQAGVLKDRRLLPGVMKAAAYHLEKGDYDCRAKWMAVAALGRIGDESAVPLLVSLIDHGNQNTRMWARASLVRITGQNLGTEKKAWGDWWNGAKKQPAITEEQLKPWKAPDTK